jgi:hypothetical protein
MIQYTNEESLFTYNIFYMHIKTQQVPRITTMYFSGRYKCENKHLSAPKTIIFFRTLITVKYTYYMQIEKKVPTV